MRYRSARKLMPKTFAAAVLLYLVCSSALTMASRSMSSRWSPSAPALGAAAAPAVAAVGVERSWMSPRAHLAAGAHA